MPAETKGSAQSNQDSSTQVTERVSDVSLHVPSATTSDADSVSHSAVAAVTSSAMDIDADLVSSSVSSIAMSAIPTAAEAILLNLPTMTARHLPSEAESLFSLVGSLPQETTGSTEWIQGLQAQIELDRLTSHYSSESAKPSSTSSNTSSSATAVSQQPSSTTLPVVMDEGGATVAVGDIPTDGGDPSTFVPIPFHLVQIHENERVRNQFRQNTQDSLLLNRKYQQVLMDQLQDIHRSRQRLKEKRDRLHSLLDPREMPKIDLPLVPNTNIRIDPPYFIDFDGNTPKENQDTIKAKTRSIGRNGKMKRWSVSEKERLREGVLAENRRILYEKLQAERGSIALSDIDTIPDEELLNYTEDINWDRVVSHYMGARSIRTALDCYIQWTNFDNPSLNDNEWSKDEIKRLTEIVEELHGRDWGEIARRLGTNRTASQCYKCYHIKGGFKQTARAWTEEEDRILTEAVATLGENSWHQVADYLDGRTAPQCLQRWIKSVSPVIRRGRWTSDEDAALKKAVELIEVDGKIKWTKVQDFVLGRTDVQCRERYMNVLAPNISYGFWDEAETNKLLKLVEKYGTSKWAQIASEMGGRTDNQCWRRWKVVNQNKDRKRHLHPVLEDIGEAVSELATTGAIDQPHPQQPGSSKTVTATATSSSSSTTPAEQSASTTSSLKPHEGPTLEDLLYQSYLGYKSYLTRVDHSRLKECHQLHSRELKAFESFQLRWRSFVDPIERVFNLGVPKKYFSFRDFQSSYLPVQYTPYELRGPLCKYLPQAAWKRQRQQEKSSSTETPYYFDELGQRRLVDAAAALKKVQESAKRTQIASLQPQPLEQPKQSHQPEQPEQPQQPEHSEQSEKAEQPEQRGQSEQLEQAERPEQAQNATTTGTIPATAQEAPPLSSSPHSPIPTLTSSELESVFTLERVCRMRPVPPCVATVRALSTLIRQGRGFKRSAMNTPTSLGSTSTTPSISREEPSSGVTATTSVPKRFQIPRRVRDSQTGELKLKPTPYAPLSLEEQQAPEFQELKGRFEAVFLWPMLGGMLHVESARKIKEAHSALRRVPGTQYPVGSAKTLEQGSVGDSSTDGEHSNDSDSVDEEEWPLPWQGQGANSLAREQAGHASDDDDSSQDRSEVDESDVEEVAKRRRRPSNANTDSEQSEVEHADTDDDDSDEEDSDDAHHSVVDIESNDAIEHHSDTNTDSDSDDSDDDDEETATSGSAHDSLSLPPPLPRSTTLNLTQTGRTAKRRLAESSSVMVGRDQPHQLRRPAHNDLIPAGMTSSSSRRRSGPSTEADEDNEISMETPSRIAHGLGQSRHDADERDAGNEEDEMDVGKDNGDTDSDRKIDEDGGGDDGAENTNGQRKPTLDPDDTMEGGSNNQSRPRNVLKRRNDEVEVEPESSSSALAAVSSRRARSSSSARGKRVKRK